MADDLTRNAQYPVGGGTGILVEVDGAPGDLNERFYIHAHAQCLSFDRRMFEALLHTLNYVNATHHAPPLWDRVTPNNGLGNPKED